MNLFDAALVVAALLCALTTGLVFTFYVVVMPGIRSLPDRDFLRAFQVMDRVIQDNDPRFIVVWGGSVVALVAAVLLGLGALDGALWVALLGVAVAYFLGVQLPTAVVNVPLNNRLKALDLDTLDAAALRASREEFEGRWTRWNTFRTVFASLCTLSLLILLLAL